MTHGAGTLDLPAGTHITTVAGDVGEFFSTASNVVTCVNYTGSTTLSVARGGTGAATHTTNNVLVGAGTSALTSVAPSTSGNVLTSNGTVWASTAPAAGGADTDLSNLTPTGENKVCQAWVNFDGTGVTLRDDHNVSTVADRATGKYTVNFSASMANVNYTSPASCFVGGVNDNNRSAGASSNDVDWSYLNTWSDGYGFIDVNYISVAYFRD